MGHVLISHYLTLAFPSASKAATLSPTPSVLLLLIPSIRSELRIEATSLGLCPDWELVTVFKLFLYQFIRTASEALFICSQSFL